MEEERRKVILAVDDSPENLQIIQNALGALYSVRMARGGQIALKAFDNHLVPDVILLDINMPGMSGFEIIKDIKKRHLLKNIPVIFVTAQATKEFVTQAMKEGASDYIIKPFTPELLRDKVRQALERVSKKQIE